MNSAGTESFVSRFNRTMCVLAWIVLMVTAVAVIMFGLVDAPSRFALVVPIGYLAAGAYLALWRPGLSVSDELITVRNVFSTVRIPWPALINVDTKYALTLYTPRRNVSVTAAPAPGSITALRLARKEGRSRRDMMSTSRPGDLPGTDSGNAALIVRDRWAKLKRAGRIELGRADVTEVSRTQNRGAILVIALGFVLSVAAVALQ